MPVAQQGGSAALSDTGRLRRNNEDRVYMDAERGIFLVADGVGGHAAGEKAAEIAVELVRARLERKTGTPEERLREAITVANNEILRRAEENEKLRGMACVLTVALLEGGRAVIGHVGDSRCYLLEPGSIRKVTHDHSPVGEQEDAGALDERAAMKHPRRNEVYRDLGSAPHAPDDANFVEIVSVPFGARSALLLCSDGLSDQVPSEQIRAIVESHAQEPRAAAAALVEEANEAGGKDNVSVVLVEGAEYAGSVRVGGSAGGGRRFPLLAVLAGLIGGLILFGVLRPHVRLTPAGREFGFGPVSVPATLRVGEGERLRTIGEALGVARPGDRIVVAPGVYRESVVLRPGVAVRSEVRRGATIEAVAAAGVTAARVTEAELVGFRIRGGQSGVVIEDSDVVLGDVEISGAAGAGMSIGGVSSGVVRGCRIVDNGGPGIVVQGAAKTQIVNNVISRNGRKVVAPGVHIRGTGAPVLEDNVISNNGGGQVWVPPSYDGSTLPAANLIPASPRGAPPAIKVTVP
ncbi:MAG: protein phosphatase 2C domain-containing protein [Bryobacteraceae bacterium]|nr:protein phosphatase 2C domain-containing protein [Bryobacteraceae bacterium]